jgi:hypothetical protein
VRPYFFHSFFMYWIAVNRVPTIATETKSEWAFASLSNSLPPASIQISHHFTKLRVFARAGPFVSLALHLDLTFCPEFFQLVPKVIRYDGSITRIRSRQSVNLYLEDLP